MGLRESVVFGFGVSLVLLALSSPARGAVILAESTFDSDTDGWTAVALQGFSFVPVPVAFAPGMGNPGGALQHVDADLSDRAAFFIAPAKFITALHSATGGSVEWDLSTLPAPGHTFFSRTDIGVIAGPDGLLFPAAAIFTQVTSAAPPTAPAYAEFELNFLVGDGWRFADGPFRGDAPLATQAEIDEVLAAATLLVIRAEYHESFTGAPGPDLTFLDNVRVLGQTSAVQEPPTLFLLAFSLLAVAAMAARRRSLSVETWR